VLIGRIRDFVNRAKRTPSPGELLSLLDTLRNSADGSYDFSSELLNLY